MLTGGIAAYRKVKGRRRQTMAAFGVICYFILSVSVLGEDLAVSDFIPSTFPNQDPSNYTLRYLSQSNGSDDSSCLQDQSGVAGTRQACQSLVFALTNITQAESESVFVSNATFISNLILLVSPGEYDYGEGGIDVLNSSSLIIAKNPTMDGEVVFRCFKIVHTVFNNLYFKFVDHLSITGISGSGCGVLGTNMAFLYVTDLNIRNCTFRNNRGGGLTLVRAMNASIEDTLFQNNTAAIPYSSTSELEVSSGVSTRYGGGLTIFVVDESFGSYFTIRNCTFKNNQALIDKSNQEDSQLRPHFYIPRGHGGGLLVLFQNSSNHEISILDSTFDGNSAHLRGGAAAVQFYRGSADLSGSRTSSSVRNTIIFQGCDFIDNVCDGYGGAIAGHAFEGSLDNHVKFQNSTIWNNSAIEGGGAISFTTQIDRTGLSEEEIIKHNIVVENTIFEQNSSPGDGSAIFFASYGHNAISTAANLQNCIFRDNSAGIGTIFSLRYPIKLLDSNVWIRNSGYAIALSSSPLTFSGDVLFSDNNGTLGGALHLNGNSHLILTEGVNIEFIGNSATVYGGAIYVLSLAVARDVDLRELPNSRCFFIYENPQVRPPDWKVSLQFLDNVASMSGRDIYSTEVDSCTYEIHLNGIEPEKDSKEGSIFDLPFFSFRNTSNTVEVNATQTGAIATEASEIIFMNNTNILKGAPGEKLQYTIECKDQLGTSQPCTYSTTLHEGSLFFLSESKATKNYQILELSAYKLLDKEFDECSSNPEFSKQIPHGFSIIQPTTGDVLGSTNIYLEITCCHPGYTLKGACELIRDNSAILREDNKNNKYIYLQPVKYAQVSNSSDKIEVYPMPVFYQNCSQQGSVTGCRFQYDKPDGQCLQGRTGIMCGSCPEGKKVELTLTSCVTCEWWHTFLIVVIVIVFTAMCYVVMVYNIGVPDVLKGSLYYIQVIGFVYDRTGRTITWDFYFSTLFGFSLNIPLCIYPGFDALYTAAMGYILPLVALLTIIVYIFSAKFVKRLSNKTSFDGIWLLSFVIYKFVAETCFRLLRCQKINFEDTSKYVFWYDGNIDCFSADNSGHLALTVVSLILSVSVLAFPLLILLISFKRFQLTQNITDVLNKGIKESTRWWSSFDLFRRILIIGVVLFFSYISPQYSNLALFFSNLLIFIVFALSKPYNNKKAVYIEIVILLMLILTSCLSLNSSGRMRSRVRTFYIFLLISPIIGTAIYLVVRATRIALERFIPEKWNNFKSSLNSKFKEEQKTAESLGKTGSLVGYTVVEYQVNNHRVSMIRPDAYREPLLED